MVGWGGLRCELVWFARIRLVCQCLVSQNEFGIARYFSEGL